jgi:hypothetical protein
MIAIESMSDVTLFIDLVDDLIGILLGTGRKDGDFEVLGHIFDELFGMRPHVEDLLADVEVDEGFVEIEDEVVGVVGGAGRQEGEGGHLEDLPLEGLVEEGNELEGVDFIGAYEQTFKEFDVGDLRLDKSEQPTCTCSPGDSESSNCVCRYCCPCSLSPRIHRSRSYCPESSWGMNTSWTLSFPNLFQTSA